MTNSDGTRTVSPSGPVIHDDVVRLMHRVSMDPHRDSWGHTPSEIESMGGYHSKPREFMQGRGGGLPYDTNNPTHSHMRYGIRGGGHRAVGGIWVGVRTATVEEMMRYEARENGARHAIRLLYPEHCG